MPLAGRLQLEQVLEAALSEKLKFELDRSKLMEPLAHHPLTKLCLILE